VQEHDTAALFLCHSFTHAKKKQYRSSNALEMNSALMMTVPTVSGRAGGTSSS
jgi:hypothetical protein